MLRYVLGISILTAGIIILRALTDGKILRNHQYALFRDLKRIQHSRWSETLRKRSRKL